MGKDGKIPLRQVVLILASLGACGLCGGVAFGIVLTDIGVVSDLTQVAVERATAVTWTPTPEPSATPLPSSTPTATHTLTPTSTPLPSDTPIPSNTPLPSATPSDIERAQAAVGGDADVTVVNERVVTLSWDVTDGFTMGMIRTGALNDLVDMTCELRGAGFDEQTYQMRGLFPSVDDMGNEGTMEIVEAIIPPAVHQEVNCSNRFGVDIESVLNRVEGARLFLHPQLDS